MDLAIKASGLIYLWFLLAMPSAAETVRLYVTNSADTTVDVIDPVARKVVQVIDGIPKPHGIAFSPDGRRVYVSSESEHVLDVVDQPSGKIIKKIALSGLPHNIAITKNGGRVLVCIKSDPGVLDVVDTVSLERVKSIPMKGGLHNVYVTPDGKYAVVGSPPAHILTVIDLQTEQPAWEIKFDTAIHPIAMETGPNGSTSRLFVQLGYFHGFVVVDFTTHKEVSRIDLLTEPKGFEAEALPEGTSHGIGVDPDGKTLWVASASTRSVFVYSLPDLKLLGNVPTGVQPDWLSFSPDGKMVYVSNTEEGTVSMIARDEMKEVARIPVGHKPRRTAALLLP
jgi:YVTN family beta-propeller protein